MNYGRLENSVVVEVIVATEAFIAAQPGTWEQLPYGVGLGWSYDGSNWAGPNGGEPPPEEPVPGDNPAEKQAAAEKRASSLLMQQQVAPLLETVSDEDLETLTYLYDPWSPDSVDYALDAIARFAGVLWKCIQPHTSQVSWSPDLTPALWVRFREPTAGPQVWIAGEQVEAGTLRWYPTTSDIEYRAITAHTTQVGWEPPNVPALWEVA